MSAERRKAATSPVTVCRCPAGWPMTVFTQEFRSGDQVRLREHHRNLCGLPDEEGDR